MPNNEYILLKIQPYTAMNILAFLREFDFTTHPHLRRIGKQVDEFEKAIADSSISDEDFEHCMHQIRIDRLIGYVPNKNRAGKTPKD